MRALSITALGKMHFLSYPSCLFLLTISCLDIIRRLNESGRGRKFLICSPRCPLLTGVILLDPDTSESVYSRYFPQPAMSCTCIDCFQEFSTIRSDLLCQCCACFRF